MEPRQSPELAVLVPSRLEDRAFKKLGTYASGRAAERRPSARLTVSVGMSWNFFEAEGVFVCGAFNAMKSSAVTLISLMLMISVLIAVGALHTAGEAKRRSD